MKHEIKERIEKIKRGEVPLGYKKTKIGILPVKWNVIKYENIAEITSSKRIKANEYVKQGIPFYRSKEIIEKSRSLNISEPLYISESRYLEISNKFSVPQEGELLVTAVGTLGIAYIVQSDDIPFYFKDGNLLWFRNIRHIDINYLKLLWKSNSILKQIDAIFNGSSQKALTIEKVKKLSIPLCHIEEQKKIANILSAWDKAIELKEKLIEEKKKQKKGLMQLLLTGKKRLPGFNGEWKEVKLGSEGTTFNGLNGKTASDFGTGKHYIPYKNVFSNSKIDISYVGYVNISDEENQAKVRYGDIFFTTSSETPEEVAISSVLLDDVKEMYLNSFCFGFRLNNFKRMLPEFLRFYLRSDAFRRKIYRLAQGSTRFNISKNEIMKIKINIPEVNEQRAISRVLEVCEKQIQLLEQELEALKLQKKGLMHLLITGIVRTV